MIPLRQCLREWSCRLGLIVFGLLLIELLCRGVLLFAPEYGQVPPEGVEGIYAGNFFFRPHHYFALEINPAYHHPEVLVNRLGLRGREVPPEKEDNETRIACLGSSTTQTLNAIANAHTYPRMLEKTLAEWQPDRQVRVINGGVGTYTSAETLIAYLFKIAPLHPDILILYEGINDVLAQAYYRKCYPDYRQYRKVWEERELSFPKWLLPAVPHSALLQIVASRTISSSVWDYSLHPPELTDDEALLRVRESSFGHYYAHNVERLILLAQHEGSTMVVVTFVVPATAPPAWREGTDRQNRILRDLARRYQLPCFDLAQVYADSPPDVEIFSDHCHFAPPGNTWRVGLIADFIQRQVLSETARPPQPGAARR